MFGGNVISDSSQVIEL